MGRQSIHEKKHHLNSVPLDKRKSSLSSNVDTYKQSVYEPSNVGEIEVVKFVTKNPNQNCK